MCRSVLTIFLKGYYGGAANAVQAYIDLLHRKVMEKSVPVHIYDPPTSPFLDDEFLEEAERLLDQAERLANNEEARFRMPVGQWAILKFYSHEKPKEKVDHKLLVQSDWI